MTSSHLLSPKDICLIYLFTVKLERVVYASKQAPSFLFIFKAITISLQFPVIVFTVANGLLIIRFSSSPVLEVIAWISPQSNLWLTTGVKMNVNIASFCGEVCIILKSLSAVIYTITAIKWCCHQLNRVSVRRRRIGRRDNVLKRYVLSLWCFWNVHPSGKIQLVFWI